MSPVADPFGLGRGDVLDNTPHWVQDNRGGTERSLGFCNPFGFETEPRVFGGLRKAEHEAYTWQCTNYADARYYMVCANGHGHDRGLIMRLCYAHVYMITKRMAGMCPACAMPPRARELDEKAARIMADWHRARPADRRGLAQALEDCRAELDEMRQRRVITSGAPLRLEEVS